MALLTTTSATIGADFVDHLSQELLLAPDVEFVFAKSAFAAQLAAGMSEQDGFDIAVQQLKEGRLSTSGMPSNIDEAMSMGMGGPLLVSAGMTYPDFIKMVQEARGPGEVIKIDRPRFIDGATTEASRILTPQSTLFGTNSQAITMDQVAVSILEYSGPGDAAGNPNPISLAKFTQHRSQHDLLKALGNNLRRDRYKLVDDIIINRLIAAANAGDTGNASGTAVRRGGAVGTNAAFTAPGNEPFTFDLLARMAEDLRTRKVPTALPNQWVIVLDQHQVADLELDPMWQRLGVFMPQYSPILPGYVKSAESFAVCVSNRMPRLTNLGASANITGYQGVVLAPNCLGWASAMGAVALRDRNDDGGRFARFGWHAYEGWQVLDQSFAELVITD